MSEEQASRGPQRALVFIDGANFYRRLKEVGVGDPNRLDLQLVASKLAGPARRVLEIRYYTGKVEAGGAQRVFASHQRLLASLHQQGVLVRLGRLEQRTEVNPLADELLRFLAAPPPGIERLQPEAYDALHAMASGHRKVEYWIQKAVDTFLAVDIAQLAVDDGYDVAYLLSQDGDLTPGIELARRYGKKVFGVGPAGRNYHIKQACDHYIVIDAGWLADCYLE
ncbi:MAG: NYN domain-containing protein [Deltaproteobacteria bacterium]|nr:NYN domain-containing protein [Deltaproteobacteria bacterium]